MIRIALDGGVEPGVEGGVEPGVEPGVEGGVIADAVCIFGCVTRQNLERRQKSLKKRRHVLWEKIASHPCGSIYTLQGLSDHLRRPRCQCLKIEKICL